MVIPQGGRRPTEGSADTPPGNPGGSNNSAHTTPYTQLKIRATLDHMIPRFHMVILTPSGKTA